MDEPVFTDPFRRAPSVTGQSPFAGDTGLEWTDKGDGIMEVYDPSTRKKFARQTKKCVVGVKDLIVGVGERLLCFN